MPKQEEVITAGLRLIPAGPTDWQFLPETPTLVTQPGGTKAVSLVEAGGSALLTVVGRLTADEDQLDRARSAVAALSGTSPAAITLRPAPLTDVRATLLLGTDGGPVQLAESTTSGAYPFDAAFQATLNPEQAAAVRGAWAGGRDLLTLRYTAALHSAEVSAPKVWTLRSSSSSSSTTTTTTTTHRSGEETSVATTGSGDSDTEEHDDLPIIQPPEMVTLDLDGADWITPHHN